MGEVPLSEESDGSVRALEDDSDDESANGKHKDLSKFVDPEESEPFIEGSEELEPFSGRKQELRESLTLSLDIIKESTPNELSACLDCTCTGSTVHNGRD